MMPHTASATPLLRELDRTRDNYSAHQSPQSIYPQNMTQNTIKQQISGMKLTEIQYVSPQQLQPNPLNDIFPEESNQYFEDLEKDVLVRGILDPLVAKPNGTLLTGHNRLRVAQKLSLPIVPVRYVIDDLDNRQETEFIIKDNLLRRHFTNEDKIKLYEHLYADFHERRLKAVEYGKALSNGKSVSAPADMLTVEQIAKDTGQKTSKVKAELYRYYKKKEAAEQAKTELTHAAAAEEAKNGMAQTFAQPAPWQHNGQHSGQHNGQINGHQPQHTSGAENTGKLLVAQQDSIVKIIQDHGQYITNDLNVMSFDLPFRRKVAKLLREMANRIETGDNAHVVRR